MMPRMLALAAACAALSLSASAFAQSAAPVDPATRQPPATLGAAPSLPVPSTTVPPGGVVAATVASEPSHAASRPTVKRPPRVRSTIPPATLTVENGRNTVFSVALYHVNRIITPFRNPEIRTSSTATLTVENGIVYVTTQTEDPIALFIFDKSSPAQAISLTLNPAPVSPVSVTLSLAGYVGSQSSYAVDGNTEQARAWETDSPYVETLKALFKDLAQNKLPQGYSLSPLNGRSPLMPACAMAGAEVIPMQLIEGAEVTAIVARVTNVTYQTIEVNEAACRSERLMGAAAWPQTQLAPGQSTELYLALRPQSFVDDAAQRPSVLRGR